MSKIRISVVMPSLNVVEYIGQCMESVVRQTLKEMEIICVDAGSTDGTLEILQDYASRDSRIRLIHSDKKSYGYQMNLALDAMRGEYLGIVETDDWVEPEMFERLYAAACENKADIVRSNYYQHYTNPEIKDTWIENLKGLPYETVFKPELSYFRIAPSIWSAIYSAEMLAKHQIRFNETPGASYQDTSFHWITALNAQRCYLLKPAWLHYRRDNFQSSVHAGNKLWCIVDETEYYEHYLQRFHPENEKLQKELVALKFKSYLWNYEHLSPELQWEFLGWFRNSFRNHQAALLDDHSAFPDWQWKKLQEILDQPIRFFLQTAKLYSTRPTGEQLPAAERIKSASVANPKVSVIVPVFNDSRYIEGCLNSLLQQTADGFEIVVVDDGSTDDTLEKVLRIAGQDARFTVLHQTNMYQGTARNRGMEAARGTYIMFLDSDDAYLPDAIAELSRCMDEKQLDILCFDGYSVYENERLRSLYQHYEDMYELKLQLSQPVPGKELFCLMREKDTFRVSVGMNIYRSSFLQQHRLRFEEILFHEDILFPLQAFLRAQRVWHTPHKYYCRLLREGSTITQAKTPLHVYSLIRSFIGMSVIAATAPFDVRLSACIRKELAGVAGQTRDAYAKCQSQKRAREVLSDYEKYVLDHSILEDSRAVELRKIKALKSFRLSQIMAFPYRRLRDILRKARKDGWKSILKKFAGIQKKPVSQKPKVLFVSSDANAMSGAFLSEVVLNRELNQRKKVQSRVILPYHNAMAMYVLRQNHVDHRVISSHSWIVPLGQKQDFVLRAAQYRLETQSLSAAASIAKMALREGFGIIHSNTTYTYVGSLAAQIARLPHVWHLHEFLEEDQNNTIYRKARGLKMVSRAQRVITISKALKDKYADVVEPKRLVHIYNGVDEAFYQPEKEIFQTEKPRFLFVGGGNSPLKGRETLIKACAALKEADVDFSLQFVGWCGQELANQVREAGLLDRTELCGEQLHVKPYYKKADIVFVCSRFGAFGRVTAEAMLSGCLVIGTYTAGTGELISDGETGLLYEYGNVEQLVEKIQHALAHPQEMRHLAAKGRRIMRQTMTSRINADQIHHLYQQVLQECSPRTVYHRYIGLLRAELCRMRCYLRKKLVLPPMERLAGKWQQHLNRSSAVEEPKVTVIMPVYNVRKYLSACLSSVTHQTLKEMEIICIDDGSTDGSSKILQRHARKDRRIVILHQENSGYGAACNRGLAAARGKYVAIVETDDFIAPEMMEHLYRTACERGEVDIVKGSYWHHYDSPSCRKAPPIASACRPPAAVFDIRSYPEILYHHPSIWSCLYKRSFLEQHAIRFVEAPGAGWVDNPFFLQTLWLAQTIAWTPEAYYYYRQTNPNASSFLKDCRIPFQRLSEMYAFVDQHHIQHEVVLHSLNKRMLRNLASILKNPHYQPQRDDPYILPLLERMDDSLLWDKRVREEEREAYAAFQKKAEMI